MFYGAEVDGIVTWLIVTAGQHGSYNIVPVSRSCLWYVMGISIYTEGNTNAVNHQYVGFDLSGGSTNKHRIEMFCRILY